MNQYIRELSTTEKGEYIAGLVQITPDGDDSVLTIADVDLILEEVENCLINNGLDDKAPITVIHAMRTLVQGFYRSAE